MKLKARTLLEALISIRDEGAKQNFGICGNVFNHLKEGLVDLVDSQLDDLFDVWLQERRKDHSYCSIAYPVAGHGEYNMGRDRKLLWSNSDRLELLHWLIMKLENPEL